MLFVALLFVEGSLVVRCVLLLYRCLRFVVCRVGCVGLLVVVQYL